jgi:hypothetical protein
MKPLQALGRTAVLSIATLAMGVGSLGPATAQEATPSPATLENPYASIFEGTCSSLGASPVADIGHLNSQRSHDLGGEFYDDIADEESSDPLDGDNSAIGPDTEGFLTEDVNDNGTLDEGEDLNDNGVLDVGLDADSDGMLDDDEIVEDGDAMVVAVNLPDIWKAEGEIDRDFDELFSSPQLALAVRQSSGPNDPLLACGEVWDAEWDRQDQIVIGLTQANESGYFGYAVFERDTGNIPVFGENTTGVTVYLFENLPTLRQERMDGATPSP